MKEPALSLVFEGAHGEHREGITYLLSVLSTWSYANQEDLREVLERPRISGAEEEPSSHIKFDLETFSIVNPALLIDAQAYLVAYKSREGEIAYLLSFRGTEPNQVIDILTDSLVEFEEWDSAKGHSHHHKEQVHRGFYLSVDVLFEQISSYLEGRRGVLYVTGHSLGGAMALLTGRRLWDEGRVSLEEGRGLRLGGIYTFGQPMVGDAAFCAGCAELPIFRHVYKQDVVPRLPPEGIATEGYQHCGALLVVGEAGEHEIWARAQPLERACLRVRPRAPALRH